MEHQEATEHIVETIVVAAESLEAVAPDDDQATRFQLLRLVDLMRDVAGSIQVQGRAG